MLFWLNFSKQNTNVSYYTQWSRVPYGNFILNQILSVLYISTDFWIWWIHKVNCRIFQTYTIFKYSWVANTLKYHVSCTGGKISVRINYFYCLFFHRRPTHKLCFLSCRLIVVNAIFSTGLVVSSVSGLGSWQLKFSTRPVANVVWTSKGLQERKHNLWVGRRWKNRQ